MDEWKSVGPSKPDYAADVEAIAKKLARRGSVNVRFADRSTARDVVLVLLPRIGELDEDPVTYGHRPNGFGGQPGIFVGVADGPCAWLPAVPDLHPAYVHGYLGWPWGHDDERDPFTDFLNGVINYIYGAALAAEEARA